MERRVIYISGPIKGVPNYWEAFERAEDELTAIGCIPLSPARLPQDLSTERLTRICRAMIDAADAVLFLPGWQKSDGSMQEWSYCVYLGKRKAKAVSHLRPITGEDK